MSYKQGLLEAIAGKNRGLAATEKDKVRILTAVEQLEDHNPTAAPFLIPSYSTAFGVCFTPPTREY